jgi:putative transposase
MPRKMRVQYPGAMYHVMSRGDQRDDIFLDDADRYDFLRTLAEACLKTGNYSGLTGLGPALRA